MVFGRSKESGRNLLLLCCLGVSWAFSPTSLISHRPLSLAMGVTTRGAHLSAPKPRTTPLLAAPGLSLRRCSARLRFHTLLSQSSGGGGSLMSLEQKIIKAAAFLTNLFPLWVLSAACLGLAWPAALAWLSSDRITAALAMTMLFMGMTLEVDDFKRVMQNPKQVFLGFMCQFTIMPLLGFSMARLFSLPPPLAVGVILVACCPGGTASNLVTLIAKADVALSVMMTTASTLAAPVMTPLLTSLLAGSLVPVDAMGLLTSTLQVVLAPVALGILTNLYFPKLCKRVGDYTPFLCVVFVSLICGSVVGQTASQFVAAGLPLLGAVVGLHAGGFVLGYIVPLLLGYKRSVAATVSIETGMQNSALGVVLATRNFADPLTALPCAISATCHSVLGSLFAAISRTFLARDDE